MADIDVYTTVLPNGVTSSGNLRFSVLLTPSLPDSAAVPKAFQDWPTASQPLYAQSKPWSLFFNKAAVAAAPNIFPLSANPAYALRPDSGLWKALVGQRNPPLKVAARSKTNKFRGKWLLSPKTHPLHQRHTKFRAAHAVGQILAATPGGQDLTGDWGAYTDNLKPQDIYIYPTINESKPGTAAAAFSDRDSAKAVLARISDPTINQRIAFGQKQLEDQEGEQLTGVALLALYQSCVDSLPSGDARVKPFSDAIQAAFLGLSAAKDLPAGVTAQDFFTSMQHYIHFHLFKSRPQDCPTQEPPNFHQTLGLFGKYPYLMRPLGLIYDFEDVQVNPGNSPAPGAATGNPLTVAIRPPDIPVIDNDRINFVPMQSVYTDLTTFQMASRSVSGANGNSGPVHINRCLALTSPSSDFTLITEDTDGTSHKLTQQQQASERQNEYQTPTPAGSKSGMAPPSPVKAVPSGRTAGLGLYHNDRASTLAQLLQSSPDPQHPADSLLHLEDVTLGYRADIMIGQQPPWMSLHLRDSTYTVESNNIVLKPDSTKTPLEADADEGFVSLGATQSPVPQSVDGADEDIQVQIHESVLVWTGWSLSVPRPGSRKVEDTVNGKPKATPDCAPGSPPHLGLTSDYAVKAGTHLPKLRFGNIYSMRLRHVDLAGNSIKPTDAAVTGTAIAQTESFSRHEPLRAPQMLLDGSPINRQRSPGEQANTMVLRDGSAAVSRRLVPPREPLRLAEMYDLLKSATLPPSAFSADPASKRPSYRLMPNGAFPKVEEACAQQWLPDPSVCNSAGGAPLVEDSDGILLPRGPVLPPDLRYYPDPGVNFIRIEPLVLQPDLCTYTPWLQDADAKPEPSSLPVYYAHVYPFEPWPNAVAMRVAVKGVAADEPLRIGLDMLSEFGVGTLPTVPTLTLELPEACTVVLRISSATRMPQPLPPEMRTLALRLSAASGPAPNPPPTAPDLPANLTLNLANAIRTLIEPAAAAPAAALPLNRVPNPLQSDAAAAAVAAPIQEAVPLAAPAALPAPARDLLTKVAGVMAARHPNPNDVLTDGSIAIACPQHPLMLVHALHKPLVPPDFAGDTGGSQFIVKRAIGASVAAVQASFSAHWMSTAKVICTASWTDQVDDPTKSDLTLNSPQPEVAFEYLNQNSQERAGKGKPSLRNINEGQLAPIVHRFRDTRARKVKYSLSACPRFSEFYPEGKSSQVDGKRSCTVQVDSSVRPPALAITYILPAFSWQNAYRHSDSSWERGRTMVLRVYLERPFLVSGDEECVGVVLAASSGKSSLAMVSQWGTDPILNNEHPLQSMNMTCDHFVCGPQGVQKDCLSFEDEHAKAAGGIDVIPFPVEFSPERKLWFCDIPLSSSRTASAFARLALVRWQPHALSGTDGEARLSQVVVADFMQIGPDRWVSVKKISATKYSVCVSGVFRDPRNDTVTGSGALTRTISCSVEQRWHRLGEDLGWRPVCVGPTFNYSTLGEDKGRNLSQWEGNVDLPHSTTFYKFRLLLEEHEWLPADSDKFNPTPSRVPKSRTTYLHYIEL